MTHSIILVAHDLPVDVRHHVLGLAEARMLDRVYTGYVHVAGGVPERWLKAWQGALSQRLLVWSMKRPPLLGVNDNAVSRTPLRELMHTTAARLLNQSGVIKANDYVKRAMSRAAARHLSSKHSLVVAREMEALEAFERADQLDIPRVYQLPTAHYATVKSILDQEYAEFPGASAGMTTKATHAPRRLARKDAELASATVVLVPSQFVKDSLSRVGVDERRIAVIPFGCESDWAVANVKRKDNVFLHVGQLSLRKGTHRLLRAWKLLGAHRTCELRMIGAMRLAPRFLSEFQGVYNHLGQVPRQDLRRHFGEAGCFVMPALAEGFAVVILEALSSGTPLAVSRNSGAEGFIDEGREGLLFDAQDDEQLCAALEWMLTHPRERHEMSHECLAKARSWSWNDYRRAFTDLVEKIVRPGAEDAASVPRVICAPT